MRCLVLVCLFVIGAHAVSLHNGVLAPGTQSDMEKHGRSPETIKIKFQCGNGDANLGGTGASQTAADTTNNAFDTPAADAEVPFKGVDTEWVHTQCEHHCQDKFCVVLPVAGESLTMETIRLVNEKSAQEAERRHNFAMRPKIIKGVKLQCGAPTPTELNDRSGTPRTDKKELTVFEYLEDTDRELSAQGSKNSFARGEVNADGVWLDAGAKQKEFVDQACEKYCGANRFCNLLEGLEDIKVFGFDMLRVDQEDGTLSKTDEHKVATATQTGDDHYVVTVPRQHIPNLG